MTGPQERAGMLPAEGVVDRLPQRRLADRLLDEGALVAQSYAGQDRLDPSRPTLSVLVAEALAAAERRGEQRGAALRTRLEELIEQRTELREERLAVARRHLEGRNLQLASSELAWATVLDEQLGALRVLLATEPAGEGQ